MREKNDNSADAIYEIIGKMPAGSASDTPLETELVFGSEASESGLVFDDCANDENISDMEDIIEEASSSVNFETVDVSKQKTEEFSIPDKFEVNAKYDTKVKCEDAPRVFTAYVPRFTEASENYRMAGEPRPAKQHSKVVSETKEATAEIYDDIDPTEELENSQEVKSVTVNVGKKEEEELSTASKVFKFADNDPIEDQIEINTYENERSEQPPSEEIPESEEAVFEPKVYRIPDPTESTSVITYGTSAAIASGKVIEEAAFGIGDPMPNKTRGKEYTAYAQRDTLKDGFLDRLVSVRVRFFAALGLTFLLALVECLYAFGVDLVRALHLTGISGAMALFDMQFVICLYILAIPETVTAFKRLFDKKLVPELFLTVSLAVMALYTAVMVIYSPAKYSLLGLVFAVFVLEAIGASYFKLSADFTAYKKISQNGEKLVVDQKYTRTLERENAALDGIVEEHKSKISRVFKTLFVSDFFKRSDKCAENSLNIGIIIASAFGASLVVGAVSFFLFEGLVSAAFAAALIMLLSYPAMSFAVHKLPYFYLARETVSDASAFVGETSVYDYSEIDVITFDDTEVFGQEDVSLQRIMLYGNSENLTKALRQMSALFMNLGGPLDVLFSDSLDRKVSAAKSVSSEDGGVVGEIDGHRVEAGTLSYMMSHGIKIPDEQTDSDNVNASTKIMYAAEDGVVYAKFYIRYSFSEEFSMLLPTLDDEGIKSLIYTRDPNITDDLIATLTAGADKIRIMKDHSAPDSNSVIYREISAGLVTLGDKTNAINAMLLSKKYVALSSRLIMIERISAVVGGALAVVLAIGKMTLIPAIALAAWQAAWCGVLHFISRKSIRQ